MGEKERENHKKELWGFLIAGCVSMAFFCLLSLKVSPLFAINDDMMIESVLSGSYLRPYPYSYYFSAELGWILSGLYYVLPAISWLGVFYFGCHVACLASLLRFSLKRFEDRRMQLVACLFVFLGMIAFCFQEFVLMHYTVLAALLGATGLFLFAMAKDRSEFIRPIIYFLLCYLVRENVFFMLAPFIAIAFFHLLAKNGFEKFKEYLPRGILFAMLFVALFTLNRGALSGESWRSYLEYNDVRTKVFDFLGIHSEEAALKEYEKENVTAQDVAMISSYDLALFSDGTGNLHALKAVEAYGEAARDSAGERLVWAVKTYVHRFFLQDDDQPLNFFVMVLYLGLFLCYVIRKRYVDIVTLISLALYRSAFWIFIFFRGRYPDRVLLSLFMMEIAFLVAMCMREILSGESSWKHARLLKTSCLVMMAVAFLYVGICNVSDTRSLYRGQVAINRGDDLLAEYMKERPENFYFLDVYTLVGRTISVFEPTGKTKENYLLMGGWMTRHPLYLEKLAWRFDGCENAKDALLGFKNTYLVIKEGAGASKESLEQWIGAPLTQVDVIEGDSVRFYVFEAKE